MEKAKEGIPEYCNSTGIANLLGKTTRRIQQLTAEGILETEIPPTGGKRKYNTCKTMQRYIFHLEEKYKATSEEGKLDQLTIKKLEAEVALKESQGQLHKLKTAIQEGKYIDGKEAADELRDFLVSFKKFALALPPRMAGIMSAYTDSSVVRQLERDMRAETEAMLTSFVDAAQEKGQ